MKRGDGSPFEEDRVRPAVIWHINDREEIGVETVAYEGTRTKCRKL